MTVEGATLLRLERYIAAILRRRWLVVALATLVMLAATAGVRFITVTNDYHVLFSADNPQLAAFNALENTYSVSNTALIAIAPREGSVFTREALGAVEELTEAAWRTPYSSRVNSLTNYTHSEALEDELIVAPLVEDASALSDTDVARIEGIALDAAEIAGRLVAHDGRTTGVAINFILPENPDQAVVEITDYLNSFLEQARTDHPGINYYMTGDVVMNRTFSDATQNDMETLTPIVFLIIIGVTIILLRSVLCTVAIVAVLVFVINTTMGFAGWNGVVFSPTNAGVPIIVMVIAIADSIHIVTSVLLGMRRGLFYVSHPRSDLDRNVTGCFTLGCRLDRLTIDGDCRIDSHQCLSGIHHLGHHGDWIPQPECLGFAAVSRLGQLRGVWRIMRSHIYHDAAAGIALDSAIARASCSVRGNGLLRPLCRLCNCPQYIPAWGHHLDCCCANIRHSPH